MSDNWTTSPIKCANNNNLFIVNTELGVVYKAIVYTSLNILILFLNTLSRVNTQHNIIVHGRRLQNIMTIYSIADCK